MAAYPLLGPATSPFLQYAQLSCSEASSLLTTLKNYSNVLISRSATSMPSFFLYPKPVIRKGSIKMIACYSYLKLGFDFS